MKLNWNTQLELKDHNIVFQKYDPCVKPRVTLGIPTYRRGNVLQRALKAVGAQTFRHFEVIISDNAGTDSQTHELVARFAESIPQITLVAQDENLGAVNNFKFLLATAKTEYFMWLADDDEITPTFVQELVALLDDNPNAVTAMGSWKQMTSEKSGSIRPQLRPDATSAAMRLFMFTALKADDSAFYGLHRTACLRKCNVEDYLPPNRGILTNYCYLLLFDMLIQGTFVFTKNASWICHNYSEKQYTHALAYGSVDRLRTLLRRINLYALYIYKTLVKMPHLAPITIAASALGLVRDIVSALTRLSFNILRQKS